MNKKKTADLIILIVLLVLAYIYAFIVDNTVFDIPILSSYLFFIPSIIYLSIREKKDWTKILATVILIGFIAGFSFTFMAELTNAWAIIVGKHKLFNVLYFPVVISMMLMVALTVVFYQHFYTSSQNNIKGLSKRFNKVVLNLSIISFIITLTCLYRPTFFPYKYSYLIIGSINLLPFLVYLIKRPKFILIILPLMVYFFTLYFLFEFVGLSLKWWSFKGSYIGLISFFGMTIPIEEFVYWMIFFSPTVICCYESFVNVKKEK